MKLEIPGQLRGRDAGKVMPAATKIKSQLEPLFESLGNEVLTLITPILRVGGELGSFGSDGIENVKIENKEAECDVVVEARDWDLMNAEEISDLIRPRILEALETMLVEAGIDSVPDFLRAE